MHSKHFVLENPRCIILVEVDFPLVRYKQLTWECIEPFHLATVLYYEARQHELLKLSATRFNIFSYNALEVRNERGGSFSGMNCLFIGE